MLYQVVAGSTVIRTFRNRAAAEQMAASWRAAGAACHVTAVWG